MDINKKQVANTNAIACRPPVRLAEIINKIDHAFNYDALLTQFIYFAKNVEEMRKKWLQSEIRCKELENRIAMDKSMYERRINELKIDIEIHHEKRLQAENKSERLQNELEKLQKQFDLFKEVLSGDKRSLMFQTYEDRTHQLISTYDLHNYELNHHHRRPSLNRNIEDTGSIISDYTEDEIDLPNDDNDIEMYSSQPVVFNNRILNPVDTNKQEDKRESTGFDKAKRNKRQSTSLTRVGETREEKRTRTRSNDVPKENLNNSGVGKAIRAITTLNLDDNGRPTTVTAEIEHVNPNQQDENEQPKNKLELSFVQPRVKNRKKRPSREFLQRSADESVTTEDSEIFWDGSQAVIDEITSDNNQNFNINNNVHVMTPIVEAPTPSKSYQMQQQQSARLHMGAKRNNQFNNMNTPLKLNNQFKSLSANSIPLAKKYKRAHLFKGQVILNSELCAHCDKRTKFGKMIMKCRDCEMVVHSECKDLLQRPCCSAFNFPAQGIISDYVNEDEYPKIPSVLQMVINEIETRGILKHEVGLYRVNGSDTQIKQLKERLIKRKQLPDLRKINEVHVLCSFVKDFLNNLNEHLITYDAWHRFEKACKIQNETEKMITFQQAIQDLPEANRDTLSFLILHLQRISETSECKMPATNLARVFGPSIVGNSGPDIQTVEIISQCQTQHQIVENLIKIQPNFYASILENNEQSQRLFRNNLKTPDHIRKSKTAVVLSSILGPATNLQSGYHQPNNDQQQKAQK